MKYFTEITKGTRTQFPKGWSILVLAGILSLGSSLTIIQTATAAPDASSSVGLDKSYHGWGKRSEQADDDIRTNGNGQSDRLPRPLANAVRRDLARRIGIPPGQIQVVDAQSRRWPNTCLGLARSGEYCGQMVVEGWRIKLSDGSQTWVYRTDTRGQILRLETQTTSNSLPNSVSNAVLRDIVRRFNISTNQLRIVRAEQRTWKDGCLGLADRGVFCTQGLVSGWQVVVQGSQQQWVYRTNQTGSVVKLDVAASQISDSGNGDGGDSDIADLQPVRIPRQDLPSELSDDIVFRAISSGGFTGRTYQTVLLKDGRVIRAQLSANGVTSETQIRQISRQEVQQFLTVLDRQNFEQFNRLSYPAVQGSADFVTVTLTSHEGTTRYADTIQNRLPESLQSVIAAWNRIIS